MKIQKKIENFDCNRKIKNMYRSFSLEVFCLLGCDTEYISKKCSHFSEEIAACIIRVDDDDGSRFLKNAGIYLPHYRMPHPEDSNVHSHLQKNLKSQHFHFLWHVMETFF